MLFLILNTIFCLLIPFGIASFISSDNLRINNFPITYFCIMISFFIHWLIFIPSAINKNEKYYDFTGMIAYLSIILFTVYYKYKILGFLDFDSIIISILITAWTLRLGLFLFYRVVKVGEDKRFKDVKTSPSKFFIWFTVSGLWVILTSLPAINLLSSEIKHNNYLIVYVGIFIWLFGFIFEVIADYQKMQFKNKIENKDKFISTGLWSISRHPNYFGEIIIWIGIFIITIPSIEGMEYLTIISPLFIYFLLTKVSGINLLESKAEIKWLDNIEYQNYKKSTPRLFPKINLKS